MSEMQHDRYKEGEEGEWQPREQPVLALGMGHHERISPAARANESKQETRDPSRYTEKCRQDNGRSDNQ
jgi:hypothetical protein